MIGSKDWQSERSQKLSIRSTQELLKLNELVIRPIHDAQIALDAVLNADDGYVDGRLIQARDGLLVVLSRLSAYVRDEA